MIFFLPILTTTKTMPGISKISVIQALFDSLQEIPDFPYTSTQLFEFIQHTDVKIPKKSSKTRITSAYDCFLKENKSGKPFGDNTDLTSLWNDVKQDPSQLHFYEKLALDSNLDKGYTLNSTGDDILRNNTSTHSKLRTELLLLQQEHSSLTLGTPSSHKPVFSGKKPLTPINNYKEWKKSQLSLPTTHSFKRDELIWMKSDDNFDPKVYNDSLPWFQFISHNMIHL